jgi:type IV fimbrial biogenesis protein FimT
MKKSQTPVTCSKQHQRGFTIVELVVTLTIAAILATIAVPSMRDFIRNGRLTSASNDLLRAYQVARTEAIKRQQNVVVCATNNPTSAAASCSLDNFQTGWIVFQDDNRDGQHTTGEAVLTNHTALDPTLTINDNNDSLAGYNGSGLPIPSLANASNQITICDERGVTADGANSTARALFVDATGRVHATRKQSEVINSVDCP